MTRSTIGRWHSENNWRTRQNNQIKVVEKLFDCSRTQLFYVQFRNIQMSIDSGELGCSQFVEVGRNTIEPVMWIRSLENILFKRNPDARTRMREGERERERREACTVKKSGLVSDVYLRYLSRKMDSSLLLFRIKRNKNCLCPHGELLSKIYTSLYIFPSMYMYNYILL